MLFSKSKYSNLIIGLGNPGPKYENTRHNIGWMCIDIFANNFGAKIDKQKFRSLIGECNIGDKRVLLCKPLTYMNLSGEAVAEIISYYKIPVENIIVISDDVSLDVGRLRIRRNGSHGGHNGIRNIIDICGSENFPRIKIGVGQKPSPDYDLANWVLGHFSENDTKKINEVLTLAAKAIEMIITKSADAAMNNFNS